MPLETHSKPEVSTQSTARDLLVAVVDISGSMQSIATDAEGGLITYLNDQKKVESGADLLLIEFDDQYIEHPLIDINDFKSYILTPRGMTAMLDAIGKSIHAAEGIKVAKGGKVIFNIVTDGAENSSKEFTYDAIKTLIDSKQKSGWEFIFSAANIDACAEAGRLGIDLAATMNFAPTAQGAQQMYAATSTYVGTMRSAGKAAAKEGLDLDKARMSDVS